MSADGDHDARRMLAALFARLKLVAVAGASWTVAGGVVASILASPLVTAHPSGWLFPALIVLIAGFIFLVFSGLSILFSGLSQAIEAGAFAIDGGAATSRASKASLNDDIEVSVESAPVPANATAATPTKIQPTGDDLLTQLAAAKRSNDAEQLLFIREQLQTVLEGADLDDIDRDLGQWYIGYFTVALRSGKAPLVVDLMERVVRELGPFADVRHLESALPSVRISAGLCAHCGKPYRGTAPACPACMAAAADHSHGNGHVEELP